MNPTDVKSAVQVAGTKQERMEANAARMLKCPAYLRDSTCAEINIRLGFSCVISEETCGKCLALGGLLSHQAQEFRRGKAEEVVEVTLRPENLMKARREVLVALTLKHRRLELSSLMDGDVRDMADREPRWNLARGSFVEAGHFQRGTLKDYLRSYWSLLFERPLDPATLEERRKSCRTCPSMALSSNGINHYCMECGCGDREEAFLDSEVNGFTKLHYPRLVCPRRRRGFSNAILSIDGKPLLPEDGGPEPQAPGR